MEWEDLTTIRGSGCVMAAKLKCLWSIFTVSECNDVIRQNSKSSLAILELLHIGDSRNGFYGDTYLQGGWFYFFAVKKNSCIESLMGPLLDEGLSSWLYGDGAGKYKQ